jgi:hypothetical protein
MKVLSFCVLLLISGCVTANLKAPAASGYTLPKAEGHRSTPPQLFLQRPWSDQEDPRATIISFVSYEEGFVLGTHSIGVSAEATATWLAQHQITRISIEVWPILQMETRDHFYEAFINRGIYVHHLWGVSSFAPGYADFAEGYRRIHGK